MNSPMNFKLVVNREMDYVIKHLRQIVDHVQNKLRDQKYILNKTTIQGIIKTIIKDDTICFQDVNDEKGEPYKKILSLFIKENYKFCKIFQKADDCPFVSQYEQFCSVDKNKKYLSCKGIDKFKEDCKNYESICPAKSETEQPNVEQSDDNTDGEPKPNQTKELIGCPEEGMKEYKPFMNLHEGQETFKLETFEPSLHNIKSTTSSYIFNKSYIYDYEPILEHYISNAVKNFLSAKKSK